MTPETWYLIYILVFCVFQGMFMFFTFKHMQQKDERTERLYQDFTDRFMAGDWGTYDYVKNELPELSKEDFEKDEEQEPEGEDVSNPRYKGQDIDDALQSALRIVEKSQKTEKENEQPNNN